MPIQRWRCPVVLQAKSAVLAAVAMAVAWVFFPLWLAVPVMALTGACGLGMCARRSEIVLDTDGGLLTLRLGLIARRIRLASIAAIQVDQAKISIARSGAGEISVYAWRKSRLDGWLRAPVAAGGIGHEIAKAADVAAREGQRAAAGASEVPASERAPRWLRSREATALALLGGMGVLAIAAALLVRVSWSDPIMTVLGAVLALGLGVSGAFNVLFSVWLLLRRRSEAAGRAYV